MEELVRALAPARIGFVYAHGQASVSCRVIESTLLVGHVVHEVLDVFFVELAWLHMELASDELAEFFACE